MEREAIRLKSRSRGVCGQAVIRWWALMRFRSVGAAVGEGCDGGAGVVDGDGVLAQGDGHQLAGVDLADLDALSGDLDAAVD